MTDALNPMELIPCRHTVTKRECDFPREALPGWRGLGWLPLDEWPAAAAAVPEPVVADDNTTTTKPAAGRGGKTEE